MAMMLQTRIAHCAACDHGNAYLPLDSLIGSEGLSMRRRCAPLLIVGALLMVAAVPAARAQTLTLTRQGVVVPTGPPGSYDSIQAFYASVQLDAGLYRMWYSGCPPTYACVIAYATSENGRNWTKHGPVLESNGSLEALIGYPTVVLVSGTYWMFYTGLDGTYARIFAATSPDGATWSRRGMVLDVGAPGSRDAQQATFPEVLYLGGDFVMWYTGHSNASDPGTIMRATSTNGLNWTKDGGVLEPGGVGAPDHFIIQYSSVVLVGSTYIMAYVGANATSSSVLYAESPDGVRWQKMGILLAPLPGVEDNLYQPDVVALPNGTLNVYYTVRNDSGNLQIYLATGSIAGLQGSPTATILGLPLLEFAFLLAIAGAGVAVVVAVPVLLMRDARHRPR